MGSEQGKPDATASKKKTVHISIPLTFVYDNLCFLAKGVPKPPHTEWIKNQPEPPYPKPIVIPSLS